METIEFFFRVHDTTPIRIDRATAEPSAAKTANLSYWAVSADAVDGYPPVLMHIYCTGRLPSDERRDQFNAACIAYVGELLTGQRNSQHVEGPI